MPKETDEQQRLLNTEIKAIKTLIFKLENEPAAPTMLDEIISKINALVSGTSFAIQRTQAHDLFEYISKHLISKTAILEKLTTTLETLKQFMSMTPKPAPVRPMSFILPPQSETTLMLAARNGYLDTVKCLLKNMTALKKTVAVNIRDALGNTALTLAISNVNAEIAEILLMHGAKLLPSSSASQDNKPLFDALSKPEMFNILCMLLSHPESDAATINDLIKYLLDKNVYTILLKQYPHQDRIMAEVAKLLVPLNGYSGGDHSVKNFGGKILSAIGSRTYGKEAEALVLELEPLLCKLIATVMLQAQCMAMHDISTFLTTVVTPLMKLHAQKITELITTENENCKSSGGYKTALKDTQTLIIDKLVAEKLLSKGAIEDPEEAIKKSVGAECTLDSIRLMAMS